MATAAERLKASLAKYSVKKEPVNEPVRNERAPVSDGLLPSGQFDSKSESTEDRDTGASTVVDREVSQNVQPQQADVQHEFVSSVVLSDQLQSTDVVVVERPIESIQNGSNGSSGEGRQEVSGDNVLELAHGATTSTTDLDTSNPVHQNFLQRLSDLEAALLARDPLMKTHLGEIHKHMIQYEEIANLLRPHEIAKIMAAQQQHTGIVLRAETLGKSKAATNKKAAKISVGDI